MSDGVIYNQDSMGGEVMEVMMTGGDGSAMNEDTLAQVVNMLQVEGQLTAGLNHTIIIRQPGTDDIQMIQATSNDGEVVISKASTADIQTLQTDSQALQTAATELIEDQPGQVMMVDETGNLVQGVMQLADAEQNVSNSIQLSDNQTSNLITADEGTSKELDSSSDLLTNMVNTNGNSQEYIVDYKSNSSAESTISANGSFKQVVSAKLPAVNNSVVIKVNTRCIPKNRQYPSSAIKITTVTGTQKYQAPKFHKCEACIINFVSRIAYMNHMESCTKKKKINIENSQYSCVFCNSKFATRTVLMQHVQSCQKGKDTRTSLFTSNVKIASADGKIKRGSVFKQGSRIPDITKKAFNVRSKLQKELGPNKTGMIFDMNEDVDNDLMENDLDSEDEEKGIIYDDDEDINDEDFEDDNIEESITSRKSMKHLGPIITNGLFKCRDCNRTFTKEHQYNRHVRACTMMPLNSSRVDTTLTDDQTMNDEIDELPVPLNIGLKKKRGRPTKPFLDENSPKRMNLGGPKIVSVDPKKVVAASLQGKFVGPDNEFLSQSGNKMASLIDDGRKLISSKFAIKGNKKVVGIAGNSISKIVKVSPSDNIIKKSGKALLTKIHQQKTMKALRDNPICGLCGDKFKSSGDLGVHMQVNHSDDLLNLRDLLDGKRNLCSTKCPLCELYFNPNSLLFHMITSHSNDLQLAQDELDALNLNLLCPYCSTVSVSQDLLREHIATKHFEKIINRPTSSSPVVIDINKLLKERTNGTNMPVSKQEKVLCPDCSIFITSSYFSHHKCVAEVMSPSDKKFVCSENSCLDVTFYKIDHLLTHLMQGHSDLVPDLEESFENLSQFLEWLKDEEVKTKMKYTKSFQRLRQGKLCCVWICHQFHNAMRDSNSMTVSPPEKLSGSSLCYSRILVETSFSMSATRYDGRTNIKYFSNHIHKIPKFVQEMKTHKKDLLSEKFSILKDSDKVAFTNTDELKSLLEDSAINNEASKPEEPISFPDEEISKMDVETAAADVHPSDVEMLDECETENLLNNQTADIVNELSESSNEKGMKVVSGLVSMTDPDDFSLEKMLGEHDSSNQVPDNFLQESAKMDEAAIESDLADQNLSCLMPTDEKVPSDVLEALGVNAEPEKEQPELKNDQDNKEEDKDSEMEESTYVLPADLEEWRKLCQLVRTNLEVSKLPEDELIEANKILNLGKTIAQEPVEKQVDVFTKLCSLANVHL